VGTFLFALVGLVGLAPAVTQADEKAGEKKAEICVLCHKPVPSEPFVPRLHGQSQEYLYRQMKAFRDGRRVSFSAMQQQLSALKDADLRDIAEYFALQPAARGTFALDPSKAEKGSAKAKEMNCGSCHAETSGGKKDVPRLSGLHPKYTALQVMTIRSKKRDHPAAESMAGITDEDAENLAHYFGQLP
jgi:cytochrome c553